MTIDHLYHPGQEAPDFVLPNEAGDQISLKGLRGRPVILYFYPEDFTPGCTKESCDFRDSHTAYTKYNAIILGISPDSPESHTGFIKEHDLPFSLLADTTHEVMTRYGVWGKKSLAGVEYEGVIRSTILIDAEGKIVRIWSPVKVEGHVAEVFEELEKLSGHAPEKAR